jgi:hypothetical protein
MLFSSQSSDQLNAFSADSLNPSALQVTSAALLSTTSSELIDPIQQSNFLGGSSASLDSATTAGIIIVSGSPDLSTDITSTALIATPLTALTPTALTSTVVLSPVLPDGTRSRIFDFLGTEGGSTLDTATNLGSLTGTPRSLIAYNGVSTTAPNDYYRVTLGANSNFNLSLTGLTADADVQFLNSVGTQIASSTYGSNHDEAINLSGLTAGDYYIRVYQYSGNTGFSLDLSSSSPSNLLPKEFELGTVNYAGTTQTGFISNSNTADVYHFSVDGFFRAGDIFSSNSSSNVNISLAGLSSDADIRVIRDSNHNGILDAGEEIVRSQLGGSSPESINLAGLGVGDYYLQVYQFNGSTPYTLNIAANGGAGGVLGTTHTTEATAYDVHTLNGTRVFSGHVSGRDPIPNTFDYPRNPNDYYHFNLGTTSNFSLSLAGLSGDADVQVLNGSNTIVSSFRAGSSAESINLQGLGAGDYYVRVYPFSTNSTGYTLTLAANPGLGLAPEPNNSLSQAYDLNTLSGNRSFAGAVGSSDTQDYYHFHLDHTSTFNLALTGLSADADVSLLGSTGNFITASAAGSTTSESISQSLAAGDYYVRVFQFSGDTNYQLDLFAL